MDFSRETREKWFWQVEFIICEEQNEEWQKDTRLNQLICSFPLDEQEELAHLDEIESGYADVTVYLEVPSTPDEVLKNFQEKGRTVQ